jgi:hypothetical protein
MFLHVLCVLEYLAYSWFFGVINEPGQIDDSTVFVYKDRIRPDHAEHKYMGSFNRTSFEDVDASRNAGERQPTFSLLCVYLVFTALMYILIDLFFWFLHTFYILFVFFIWFDLIFHIKLIWNIIIIIITFHCYDK